MPYRILRHLKFRLSLESYHFYKELLTLRRFQICANLSDYYFKRKVCLKEIFWVLLSSQLKSIASWIICLILCMIIYMLTTWTYFLKQKAWRKLNDITVGYKPYCLDEQKWLSFLNWQNTLCIFFLYVVFILTLWILIPTTNFSLAHGKVFRCCFWEEDNFSFTHLKCTDKVW